MLVFAVLSKPCYNCSRSIFLGLFDPRYMHSIKNDTYACSGISFIYSLRSPLHVWVCWFLPPTLGDAFQCLFMFLCYLLFHQPPLYISMAWQSIYSLYFFCRSYIPIIPFALLPHTLWLSSKWKIVVTVLIE